jgi:trehalose/maltose hydrolase-like predicted phosphorylase
MSFVINSIMASDLGDLDYAYRQFIISAGEDLDEELTGRRDTSEGIHGTASGGAWMAVVFGFGGITLTDDRLIVNPRLPRHWKSLAFNLMLRGERVSFQMDHSRVRIAVGDQKGVQLDALVAGHEVKLVSGKCCEVGLAASALPVL